VIDGRMGLQIGFGLFLTGLLKRRALVRETKGGEESDGTRGEQAPDGDDRRDQGRRDCVRRRGEGEGEDRDREVKVTEV
jgi:hypothetical protein